MIGVIAPAQEMRAVAEFFELFKTPWEPYTHNRVYDAVIVAGDEIPAGLSCELLMIFGSAPNPGDGETTLRKAVPGGQWLEFNRLSFPVYGDLLVFNSAARGMLRTRDGLEGAGVEMGGANQRIVRVGYDLFREIAFLFSQGQPRKNALCPAIEIHAQVIRQCLWNAGVSFVEVPPAPAGHEFMVCLSHDVDFAGIRRHRFDRTFWGFLFRAVFGSVIRVARGDLWLGGLWENWKAVLSLPLVHLGLKDDFWLEFERYLEIERGLGSTFFFLPYKNDAGRPMDGISIGGRAAAYDVNDLREELSKLLRHDCEVGLHAIDAWYDSEKGCREVQRVDDAAGRRIAGSRTHWLFADGRSPKALEDAGLQYDSTAGYNDAVGFRAGTTQVFCPPSARSLLELPLNIQDTALFYPDRMNLHHSAAMECCDSLLQTMATYGGALTVNWHTRSLSPERLWGDSYLSLLQRIQGHSVCFATAAQVANWFRIRRELRFHEVRFGDDYVRMTLSGQVPGSLPGFTLHVYDPRTSCDGHLAPVVVRWQGESPLEIPLCALPSKLTSAEVASR